jgi:hypothetical protein
VIASRRSGAHIPGTCKGGDGTIGAIGQTGEGNRCLTFSLSQQGRLCFALLTGAISHCSHSWLDRFWPGQLCPNTSSDVLAVEAGLDLYVTEWFFDLFGRSLLGIPRQRFGDQILGAKADCERQREHNSSEKNAECKLDNTWGNP